MDSAPLRVTCSCIHTSSCSLVACKAARTAVAGFRDCSADSAEAEAAVKVELSLSPTEGGEDIGTMNPWVFLPRSCYRGPTGGLQIASMLSAILLAGAAAASAASPLGLILNTDASYVVTLSGKPWLSSPAKGGYGEVFLWPTRACAAKHSCACAAPSTPCCRSKVAAPLLTNAPTTPLFITGLYYDGAPHTVADGSLTLDAPPAPISGSDSLGDYTGYAATFAAGRFGASFKLYAGANALMFSQTFPAGLNGTAAAGANAHDELATAFPVFGPTLGNLSSDLAFLTWPHCMCTGATGLWTSKEASGAGLGNAGTPLLLYSRERESMMISPANNLMTTQLSWSHTLAGGALGAGENGAIEALPAGHTVDTIIVAGAGMNNTVMAWGDVMLARGGKTRTLPEADLIVSTLGWWSDNGAYYYYLSEPGKNMQETVVDALAYWDSLNLPTQHVMYDSWWYWKECSGATQSWLACKGAVELWEPRDDVFPDGFNFKLKQPLALHNRACLWAPAQPQSARTQGAPC